VAAGLALLLVEQCAQATERPLEPGACKLA